MTVPKPIHKFLLGEGFLFGWSSTWYRFLPSRRVAQAMVVHETSGWMPGQFIKISLDLVFPYFFPYVTVMGGGETLCNDGLLRPDADLPLYWSVEQHAQALEVLRTTMRKWLDALSDPDVMIALLDYHLGLRETPLVCAVGQSRTLS